MALPQRASRPLIKSPEFFNIEIAPLAAGGFYVSLTATTVDDEEPQLLTQEIVRGNVDSLDEAFEMIRQGVLE